MRARFVHLHVHSHHSFLHAAGSPAEFVAEAARSGMEALALTDHLGLWGAVEFFREAQRAGIRPILGCEVRVGSVGSAGALGSQRREGPFPLILLARDRRGYENLVGLVSRSFLGAGRPGEPPGIAAEELARHREGLFAISPALDGEIGHLLRTGDERGAAEAAATRRDLLGADQFFLELSDRGLDGERRANRAARRLATDLGLGVVAGNGVHFPRQGDPLPPGTEADAHLRRLALGGLYERLGGPASGETGDPGGEPSTEYLERLEYELRVIAGRGLATYFRGVRATGSSPPTTPPPPSTARSSGRRSKRTSPA